MPDPGTLTERQQKWFASVHDGLERETGRTLAAWAELARACPETAHRKRLAWMKAQFGLGQNRASMVLNAAFPPQESWSTPDQFADRLWADQAGRAVHEAIREQAQALPGVVTGQRKGFTAYSRNFQFAAVRPARIGAILGLAISLTPALEASGLQASGKDGWSERLVSRVALPDPAAVTPQVTAWLRAAWERS